MTRNVLILGSSGKIGAHAAVAFEKSGWRVRCYDRAANNMRDAARGMDVIVNGLNPPMYHDWETLIPQITGQVLEAAKASGATVMLPGNIYNFGLVEGEINEDTPQNPNTRKGAIRVAMEQRYRASGVQTIVLRAGHFVDPTGNGDLFSMMLLRKPGRVSNPGDANVCQAYAYTPDWAEAAVLLADRRTELSSFEDIPFPGHHFTFRDLLHHLDEVTGRRHKMTPFPWWAIRLAAPFVEVARELREMQYLYRMPHWLGSDKFNRLVPEFQASTLKTVLSAGPHTKPT